MLMSTPCAKASKYTPAVYVLSSATGTPRACAAATIAGTSCTSIVTEPGLSVQTSVVFGRRSPSMPAPMSGSYVSTSMPMRLSRPAAMLRLGPYALNGTSAWLPAPQHAR